MEDKASNERLENVRQWQKHYRKAFPNFVFYFESLPHEVRVRCLKQVNALGAVSLFSILALLYCMIRSLMVLWWWADRGQVLFQGCHSCRHYSTFTG